MSKEEQKNKKKGRNREIKITLLKNMMIWCLWNKAISGYWVLLDIAAWCSNISKLYHLSADCLPYTER